MRAKPMQPVFRAWALNGCLAVTIGVIALVCAVVAGLMTGTLWLAAALRVRQQELRRTRGRLVMGNRASRFRPWTGRFYVVALQCADAAAAP